MQNSTTNIKKNTKKVIGPSSMISFGEDCARAGMFKILLYGDLGAGKTHFAKGFLQYFGIPESEIYSPTYAYVNEYLVKNGQGKFEGGNHEKIIGDLSIGHFDLYRIEDFESLVGKGLLDTIVESDIVLIERPKFEEEYIDDDFVKVRIEKASDEERIVTIT